MFIQTRYIAYVDKQFSIAVTESALRIDDGG